MENRKLANVLLAIMGVLIILALVARIVRISSFPISAILQIINLAFVALYGFWLYKKPHGNILKYAMLLFAFTNILISLNRMDEAGDLLYIIHIIRILTCATVCYGAGRLNRIDKNKYLFPLIAIVFLGLSTLRTIFYPPTNLFTYINNYNYSITFITLMIAYFVRYKTHKEAGLADAIAKP